MLGFLGDLENFSVFALRGADFVKVDHHVFVGVGFTAALDVVGFEIVVGERHRRRVARVKEA